MRLIDADALLEILGLGAKCEECKESVRGEYCAANPDLMFVCVAIADAPTIEPKRGKWKHDADGLVWCYECGFGIERSDERPYHYCPNCGAQMERSEE